jgi:lipopolysaccharide/colanic/teichoic acid biosynthesis glycosyltransferase
VAYGDLDLASAAAERPRPHGGYLLAKRILDVVCASVLLVGLLPILLLVALAVKLSSPGPVLLRQRRVGYLGREIRILKFRSMLEDRRHGGSDIMPPLIDRRQRHKSPNDPRITKVGRVLRRTALDELPQLWNIVRGDMSLVGPRPELPEVVASYEPWQHARHLVMPGLTGWWQITRDDHSLMCEATELDLYYVDHCSMALDLLILLRTAGALIRGTGAY